MALAIEGTPIGTDAVAAATTVDINIPSGVASGELLCVFFKTGSTTRSLVRTDWTDESTLAHGLIWIIADGTETSPLTFSYTFGSTTCRAVAMRISGFDAASPTNGGNTANGSEASEDPFTLAADVLTGVNAGSWIFVLFNSGGARTITTLDAAYTAVLSIEDRHNVVYEAAPGSGNASTSTDMSAASVWGWDLTEINAAAAAEYLPPDLAHRPLHQPLMAH